MRVLRKAVAASVSTQKSPAKAGLFAAALTQTGRITAPRRSPAAGSYRLLPDQMHESAVDPRLAAMHRCELRRQGCLPAADRRGPHLKAVLPASPGALQGAGRASARPRAVNTPAHRFWSCRPSSPAALPAVRVRRGRLSRPAAVHPYWSTRLRPAAVSASPQLPRRQLPAWPARRRRGSSAARGKEAAPSEWRRQPCLECREASDPERLCNPA